MRWPHEREIEHMTSTEAYELYYGLPAPAHADQLAIIRALGDKAWQMRQEEDSGKAKRSYLPMPEKAPEIVATEPLPSKPKPAPKPKAEPKREGGASFFLAGLKL